ncbi:hypothetical protein, variant [Blastomyces dermatitidis ER-3]|uniref:Uncharacterized protein n=1 Tax=Ajellomyces dermatitidis (strain ER-3 / ATCC MYA-2586) TaxID=559297 RepID=A0ABX2VR44_AJEDR|nr:hypothetical protein, variant [Blastomyces dermatitidis ER-3]OAS99703.1 hypothetical protein, variant [Blastomyces dermatitidis ER-3]
MHIGHEAGNFCYIPFAAGQKLEHILADNSSLQPHAPSSLLVGVGVDQVPGIRCTCVIWLNQITRMNATVEALSLGAFADLSGYCIRALTRVARCTKYVAYTWLNILR